MTPFEHLAVLISLILGLGITHLLTAVHHLVVARARVRHYWLTWLWVVLTFVVQVEWWWASFGLREHTTWNFFYFLFILLSPVALYLATTFVLPTIEPGAQYDLRAYYYRSAPWLFGAHAASLVLDGIRRGVHAGSWKDLGSASNFVSAVLVGSLAVTRRPAYHAAVTLALASIFLYFIVAAALQLR